MPRTREKVSKSISLPTLVRKAQERNPKVRKDHAIVYLHAFLKRNLEHPPVKGMHSTLNSKKLHVPLPVANRFFVHVTKKRLRPPFMVSKFSDLKSQFDRERVLNRINGTAPHKKGPFFSVKLTAVILGISEKKVQQLRRQEMLEHDRYGRIYKESVLRFIEGLK